MTFIGFVAVTEDAVTNTRLDGSIFFQPAVLGGAVVARWKFVANGNDLVPSAR
jgi:hypothetical protein